MNEIRAGQDYLFLNHEECPSVFLRRMQGISLSTAMDYIRSVVVKGKEARTVKVRQPLQSVRIFCDMPYLIWHEEFREMLRAELNVKYVLVHGVEERRFLQIDYDTRLTPELEAEGAAAQEKRVQAFSRQQKEKGRS